MPGEYTPYIGPLVPLSDEERKALVRDRLAQLDGVLTKKDVVLSDAPVDAGPLARLQLAEMHRLLAPVLEAAAFSPAHEKASDAIARLLAQWRSGLEPCVPPSSAPTPTREADAERVFSEASGLDINDRGEVQDAWGDVRAGIRAVLALRTPPVAPSSSMPEEPIDGDTYHRGSDVWLYHRDMWLRMDTEPRADDPPVAPSGFVAEFVRAADALRAAGDRMTLEMRNHRVEVIGNWDNAVAALDTARKALDAGGAKP